MHRNTGLFYMQTHNLSLWVYPELNLFRPSDYTKATSCPTCMHIQVITNTSLVDGRGLRTFLGDPMHKLESSGYTLSGIYIDFSSETNLFP